MANYRLISKDAVVQVSLGGEADGGAPTWGTALPLTGTRRDVKVTTSIDTVNVAGGGDDRNSYRAKRGGTTVTIEKAVIDTGADFVAAAGEYAKVEIKELGSMVAYVTYTGIITEFEWAAGDDEQIERLTVLCDAEHA